ncbi:MaoC family dehydratase [Monashia sp. NPDC004114]
MTATQQAGSADNTGPVMRRGHTFEEHVPGRVFLHRWRRTVLESDNALFTTATLGFGRRYLDRTEAQERGLPGEQINPMLVFSIVFGLSVEDLSEIGGPFLGGDDVLFGAPVFPGDTLQAQSTVIEARESTSRPEIGIVTWETIGRNQAGAEVIRYRRSNQVRKGPLDEVIDPVDGYAEDYPVGFAFRHTRSKTVGEIDLALLTPLVMNSAPGHFSDHLMANTPFGERINFGGQTLSLVVGIAQEDTTERLVAEIGLTGISFARPVVAGDTIAAHSVVIAVAPGADSSSDDVTFRHTGLNQRGEVVCRVDRTVRLLRRAPRRPHRLRPNQTEESTVS